MFGTHPLVRYINQNRRQIIIAIIVIVMILIVLRVLNSMAEKNQNTKLQNSNVQYEISASDKEKYAFIEKFLNYCYKKDESNAYALLSLNAKETYSTKEQFKVRFIDKYILQNKKYSVSKLSENDNNSVFQIKIKDNALLTGNVTSNENMMSFNITLEKENNEYKINVN